MATQCEKVEALLPDYWTGSMGRDSKSLVEAHLAGCLACSGLSIMWNRLGTLPDERPGPALRTRFDAMLEAYQHGFEHGGQQSSGRGFSLSGWFEAWWPSRPAFQFGIAVACLLGGGLIGYLLTASRAQTGELARLHEELTNTREMVAVSLLQQQSAGERLRGVSWSDQLQQPDTEVLSALGNTVKFDTSVDVRLAAVDVLHRHGAIPLVRKSLLDALNREKSPLVQLALIEALANLRERESVSVLKRLEADRSVDENVRQRAGWAIQQF